MKKDETRKEKINAKDTFFHCQGARDYIGTTIDYKQDRNDYVPKAILNWK